MQALLLLTLVFAVLVAVFAIQNAHLVTIYFLKWQFDASLGLIILFSLLIGAVLLGVFDLINQAKVKWKKPWWSREKKAEPEGEAKTETETSGGDGSKEGPEPEKKTEHGGEYDNPQELEDS